MTVGTVFVSFVLLCVAALAVRTLIRDKKQGKHICGGNCAQCHGCGHRM